MRNKIFFTTCDLTSNFGTSSMMFPALPIFWVPFFGKTFIPTADSTFVQMQLTSRLTFCPSFYKTTICILTRLLYLVIRIPEIRQIGSMPYFLHENNYITTDRNLSKKALLRFLQKSKVAATALKYHFFTIFLAEICLAKTISSELYIKKG